MAAFGGGVTWGGSVVKWTLPVPTHVMTAEPAGAAREAGA
jgi:hypothetical protein